MSETRPEAKIALPARARAFFVHVFTASGAAFGLMALLAAVASRWSLMFAWLGLALIVDAADGTIARRLHVAERLPRWSGETLDLVVDFVTYVFVPAYAIVSSGVMPSVAAVPAAIVIVVTSGLYFADRRMKTADNYFRGFPALWNLAAFYLLLLRPDPWIGFAFVVVLAAMTFVPIPFVHPFRVARLRLLNTVLLGLWAVLAAIAVWRELAPALWVTVMLVALLLYFFLAGALRRAAPDKPPSSEPA